MPGDGLERVSWQEYRNGWRQVEGELIEEALVGIYVNGRELATIMATPSQLEALALGFLKNEGFIDGMDEVEHLKLSADRCCVDVWLKHAVQEPKRVIITSGCGGGVTFKDPQVGIAPLPDGPSLAPQKVADLMACMHRPRSLHARARGVHTAALADGERLLAVAEDVGRHNTLDKLLGICLQRGLKTEGTILMATGRVSSEMLRKAALMGCPIIASRNSPTSLSVAMARAWNITLIGYVRRDSMRVYAHPERLNSYAARPEGSQPLRKA